MDRGDRRRVAQDLFREWLREARREEERHGTRSERLRALVRAGPLAGLGPARLADASGLTRAGVYEVQRRQPQGVIEHLEEVVLAALGASAALRPEVLADALRVEEEEIEIALAQLAARGAIAFGSA